MIEDAEIVNLTRTVTADSAEEFLNAISPLGALLNDGRDSTTWIFRGEPSDQQSEQFLPLVPAALRPSRRKELWRLSRLRSWDQTGEPEYYQVHAEFLLLRHFFEYADRCGLPVPEDRQTIRKLLQHVSGLGDAFRDLVQLPGTWIPDELLSLAGLAQHYGLPTRLLDWTRDHCVAAYFAAKASLRVTNDDQATDQCIVVWALKESALYDWRQQYFRHERFCPLRIVTSPAALNPNLHAQQGLFTTWKFEDVSSDVVRQSLNERLAKERGFRETIKEDWVLACIRLPQSEARNLLQCLIRLGVIAGRLFPGFAGAARSMRDFDLAFGEDFEF